MLDIKQFLRLAVVDTTPNDKLRYLKLPRWWDSVQILCLRLVAIPDDEQLQHASYYTAVQVRNCIILCWLALAVDIYNFSAAPNITSSVRAHRTAAGTQLDVQLVVLSCKLCPALQFGRLACLRYITTSSGGICKYAFSSSWSRHIYSKQKRILQTILVDFVRPVQTGRPELQRV